jgi:O-antigen/teichoic acid export membrane protein
VELKKEVLELKQTLFNNVKIAILFGMLFAGLSQIIFIFAASSRLSVTDFAQFINWTALNSVALVAIGSPLVSLIAIDLNVRNLELSQSIRIRFSQAKTISIVIVLFTGVIWIYEQWHSFNLSSLISLIFLSLSGLIQALSGAQRGLYLSQAKWTKTSLQLFLDGFLRIGLALIVILTKSENHQIFILGNTLIPLAAFMGMCVHDKNLKVYFPRGLAMKFSASGFYAFWASSLSLHGMITFSPSLFALRGVRPEVVAALGLGLYIIRTPITASNSFTAPMLQRFTIDFGSKNYIKAKKHLINVLMTTVSTYTTIIVLIYFFGAEVMKRLTQNIDISDDRILVIFGISSLAFLIALELSTYLVASEEFKTVTKGWLLGLVVFLVTSFSTDSIYSIGAALSAGALITSLYFAAKVFGRYEQEFRSQ